MTTTTPDSAPDERPSTLYWDPTRDLPAEEDLRESDGLREGYRLPNSRIEISSVIGEGATSIVFRGEHVDLGRPLAVKVLRNGLSWPGLHERFAKEARVTIELDSPFVVDVVDFGELEDGRLWSAMELLEGCSLADTIDGEGAVSPKRAIALLRMACKGLHAAHRAGIVHRDIKPENLMLVERHGREQLIVVDFGLATADGPNEECCGTPRYMAPEQILREPLDGRTDLYALGCCAFEMLTGRAPAQGVTIDDVLAAHLDGTLLPFPLDSDVPRPLQAVVERCLAHDPDDRYASAADLEAALVEAQLAADLRCTSDSLEPPEVEDADHRRRLQRGLSRPPRAVRMRRFYGIAAGLFAFSLVGAVWANDQAAERERVESSDRDDVLARVTAAQRAFDAGRYVYPSEDAAREDTAYRHLVALEHWNGPADALAERHASELRDEMAAALESRGDALWEAPERRGEARDLYAQALVFDPDREGARDRVGMTTEQVEALRQTVSDAPTTVQPSAPPKKVRAETPPPPPPAPRAEAPQQPAEQGLLASDRVQSRQKVRQARRAARRGDDVGAREAYEAALALDEHNASAYAGLADLHFEAGRHRTALRYAKQAVRYAPSRASNRLRLGDSYVRLGEDQKAKDQYTRAAALGSLAAKRRLEVL